MIRELHPDNRLMSHCSNIIHSYIRFIFIWGHRGRDRMIVGGHRMVVGRRDRMIVGGHRMVVGRRGRMVVGFTTTFAISSCHHH